MQDRRSRFAASILALLAAISLWLSLGTVAVISGDTHRIAALPSIWILIALAAAAVASAWLARLRVEEAWPLLVTLLLWLPFLPLELPSSVLMWQGPLEVFVWVIALVGVMASRPPKIASILVHPDRAPWIAGAIVAVAALAVFSQVRGVIPGGDEPHYLAATQSILKDFDLKVANNYANGDYLDYFPGRLEPHFLKRSTSGEIYSIHAPGVSIIVLPAFALAGYAGAVLTMILIAALTAAITWRLAWRVSGSVAGAWVGVAAVFTTTPYFFHIFTIYPEIAGSLGTAIGAWLLVDLEEDREISNGRLIASGAALAMLPWLHSRFAVIAAALGLVIVLRLAARRLSVAAVARFLAVPIIAGAAWFAFFWVVWGSPSPTAPYGVDTSTSSSYILRGLIGLIVDQQFGLVTTAPIYVLAILGVFMLARSRPRLTMELALVAVPYALAVASYAMWWGGSAAPARFLVAVLPLAALPIAVLFRAPGRLPMLTALLLIISVGLALPRTLVDSGRLIYNNRAPLDATIEWLSQVLDLPHALPSVHRDGGSTAISDASIWLLALTPVCVAAWRMRTRTVGAAWAILAAACAIAAMIATGLVADFRQVRLITPDRSKLASLAEFRPAWHRIVLDLPVGQQRRLTGTGFLEALSVDLLTPASRLNRLPAGEYEIHIRASEPLPNSLAMFVGRNDPPVEQPHLDDLGEGQSAFRFRMPVAVRTLNLVTNEIVGDVDAWASIRPLSVVPPASPGYALHANRYGHARAFFFDDWAYPEKGGFWTRANGSATVVLDTDEGTRQSGLPISITAGAVATTIELSIGKWEESLSLAAGQKQDVVLPPADSGAWALQIRSGAGVRPSERESGNNDVRSLAAWVAIH